ncbi:LysR family transcriptional regulator [Streptomyces sp. NPDC049555]|uniref:LysR family transcriptional regulator n=1 Tax=unclassified Streptomyces TaxID=2593676 RepID=UPI0034373C23
MLDLSRLRALYAVSVHGTVTAAADALGYTPSAVSQAIAKLERETRTTLLERRGRGVALTDAAERLAATAKDVLAIVERAETDLEERRGLPAGRLMVGAFPSAARGLLPSVLAALGREHPAVDARLMEVEPHLSVGLVEQGVLDVAVAFEWDVAPLPAPEGLRRAPIGEDVCDLLVPRDHPLAERAPVLPADLAHQRWISQQPGSVCYDWLVRTLRASGSEPDLAYQATENHTHIALVAAGLGIAVAPRLGRGPLPPGVLALPVEPVPVRRLFAYWRTGTTRRPAIRETVRLLSAHWHERELGEQ